jgi:hypothetical protein
MSARQKVADTFGGFAMTCGVLLGIWSVHNAATRPKFNELDVIDLLLGVGIGVTLVWFSVRLWQRRSPWRTLLVGLGVSSILVILALLRAAQNGLVEGGPGLQRMMDPVATTRIAVQDNFVESRGVCDDVR